MQKLSAIFYLLIFSVLFSVPIQSQTKVDSLKTVLMNETSHISRINTLVLLSKSYHTIQKDSSVFYAEKAYNLSLITDNPMSVASAACNLADMFYYRNEFNLAIDYYKIAAENEKIIHGETSDEYGIRLGDVGYCFYQLGIYDIAVSYYDKALMIAEKTENSEEIYTNINNIAQVYFTWGEYDKATNAYDHVLEYDKKQNNASNISSSYNNIGKVYSAWGKHIRAIEYYNLALDYSRKSENLSQIAVRYSNIGMAYYELDDFDKALKYLEAAIDLDKKQGNLIKLAVRQNELGRILTAKKKYKEAIEYHTKALNTFKKTNFIKSQSIVYKDLGDIYLQVQKYNSAEKNYRSAGLLAEKIGSVYDAMNAYKGLSDLYKTIGKYEKSLQAYLKYDSLNTLIFNTESNRQISAFEVKYETEKKEKEITLLKNEALIKDVKLSRSKILWISFLVISVLLISIAIILIKRNTLKAEINKILSEKNNQLNILNATKTKFFAIISHDLLNPLSAIHTLANAVETSFNDINKDQLFDFIKELNKSSKQTYLLLQNLLAWASVNNGRMKYEPEDINLRNLINEVILTLQINADEKKISINTDIPDDTSIPVDKLMISTVLRNLISNAIKFSFEKSQINIFSEEVGEMVKITVKDNGKGISYEDVSKLFRIDIDINKIGDHAEKGTGLGLILCKELTEKCGGKIWAKSELNKGSEFIFTVPRKNQ